MSDATADTMMRLPTVIAATGLSRTEIYRRIAAGSFPAQRRISHKLAVWSANAVQEWIDRQLNGAAA